MRSSGNRNRLAWSLVLFMASAALVGCHHVTYTTGKAVVGEPITGSHSYYLGGVVGKAYIDIPQFCPNGVSKIHLFKGFVDGLLTSLTLGIWAPRSYEIWCASTVEGDSPQSPIEIPGSP